MFWYTIFISIDVHALHKDLSAWACCWQSVSIRRNTYTVLNVYLLITKLLLGMERWGTRKSVDHTIWMARVTPTDRPKSVCNCTCCIRGSVKITESFLGHRSQRLQWPIVITRCPASVVRRPSSVVRRPSSVVRRPLDYLHFRLLLQNRLMDFDETWYGWNTQGPLQVLLFFGQIRPGADPGRGKNRSRGVPFFRKLLLHTERLQQQTECIAVI